MAAGSSKSQNMKVSYTCIILTHTHMLGSCFHGVVVNVRHTFDVGYDLDITSSTQEPFPNYAAEGKEWEEKKTKVVRSGGKKTRAIELGFGGTSISLVFAGLSGLEVSQALQQLPQLFKLHHAILIGHQA